MDLYKVVYRRLIHSQSQVWDMYFTGLLRNITKLWIKSMIDDKGNDAVVFVNNQQYSAQTCLETVRATQAIPRVKTLEKLLREKSKSMRHFQSSSESWKRLPHVKDVEPVLDGTVLIPFSITIPDSSYEEQSESDAASSSSGFYSVTNRLSTR